MSYRFASLAAIISGGYTGHMQAQAARPDPTPNGVWLFTIRGDSLVGELRLPDGTKVRDVRTARSR